MSPHSRCRFPGGALPTILLVFLVLGSAIPAPGQTDLVAYFTKSRETLHITGVETGESFELGELHREFRDFAFDSDGALWGIAENGLFQLNSQSALPKRVGNVGGIESYNTHMAISPQDEVWISQVFLNVEETLLLRGDLSGGFIIVAEFEGIAINGLTFYGDRLIALIAGSLFEVDPQTFELTQLGQGLGSDNLLYLAAVGERLFSTVVPLVAPPTSHVVELFPETGETQSLSSLGGIAGGLAMRESSCFPSATNLCFGDSRFRVTVDWRDAEDQEGQGRRLPYTSDDSGLFEFFGEDNWELLVKVLSGCNVNNRYWVIASASTDVAFTLRVEDTETGEERTYENPLGNPAGAITDTDAFSGCP